MASNPESGRSLEHLNILYVNSSATTFVSTELDLILNKIEVMLENTSEVFP